MTNPTPITAVKRATIALVNHTKTNLHIKNNKISTLGSQKGQWAVYKELTLAPGACATTEALQDETHQLMVYSVPRPDDFLYVVADLNLEDATTIKLYDGHFEIVPGLSC